MDIKGEKVYLSEAEVKNSGYQSPIDLTDFDIVHEHEANLHELDRLDELRADDDRITASERGQMVPQYGRVAARLAITSELITEDTMQDHGLRLVRELEEYLDQQ